MRVFVVTDAPQVWGAEIELLTLLRGATTDHEIQVATSLDSPLLSRLADEEIPHHGREFALSRDDGKRPARPLRRVLDVLRSSFTLRKELRSWDVVVVWSVWLLPEVLVAAWLAGTPVVLGLHETFRPGSLTKILGELTRFVYVIAPSRAVFDDNKIPIRPRTGFIGSPVEVHRRGDSWANRSRSVCIVGQIVPHKRVLELVEGVNWRGAGYSLLIVGGEPSESKRTEYEREVRRIAAHPESCARVVDRVDDPAAYLSESMATVNCSEHEAFGRSIAEAMMIGTYPIAIGMHGPSDIIKEVGWGTVVESFGDLQRLLEDGIEPHEEGAVAARVRASELYGAIRVRSQFLEMLADACAPRRLRGRAKDG